MHRAMVFFGLGVLLLSSCSGKSTEVPDGESCEGVGTTKECDCEDGSKGIMICQNDGAYGDCVCSDSGADVTGSGGSAASVGGAGNGGTVTDGSGGSAASSGGTVAGAGGSGAPECDPSDDSTLENCPGRNPCCTDEGQCGFQFQNECRVIRFDGGIPGRDGSIRDRDGGFPTPEGGFRDREGGRPSREGGRPSRDSGSDQDA